jgi:endoglycosylceramidase
MAEEPDTLELRPLSVSDDSRIVDDRGREVLLRGVNITSLGEYWQGHPDWSPTLPTTDEDWDAMAARGLSVIRLVVHWSRLQPQRGAVDEAYLDEIEAMVDAAAAHGMYTVIDMHQDAFSAFIYTAEDEVCPDGSWPGASPAVRRWRASI